MNNSENDVSRLLAGARPMHFRASGGEFVGELDQVFVEVIERFPFGFCRRLPRRRPILESGLGFVAYGFILPQRSLDELPVP
jgi:hypothetical protein